MTTQTRADAAAARGIEPRWAAVGADVPLERRVCEVMTPCCDMISASATVADAAKVLADRGVPALLVLDPNDGTALGWITAGGLPRWLDRGRDSVLVLQAISERVIAVHPQDRVRTALNALALGGTTRLLVRCKPERVPLGVVTAHDLATAGIRDD
jgi:predicted transcriptional regulator